ncbi:MFS transporter [Corynebacterium pyruviciproducens]
MLTSRKPLPRQTEITGVRRRIILFVVALGGFGIGITEFVSMGLLPLIAADFGVSENTAGHVITSYAMGVTVGAPLITVFTGKLPRRRLIILLMVAFTVGNALTLVAWDMPSLLVARFIAGFPHGAYFSVSTLCVVAMTPKGQRGRVVALTSLGFSAATLGGVPAVQWLGQATHWSMAYAVVAAVGLVTLVAFFLFMPHMTEMPQTSPLTELSALKNVQVLLTVLIGMVGFGGMFAVYTYIGWTMTDPARAAMSPHFLPFVLMAYGFGGVAGNMLGGWIADRNIDWGIITVLTCIAVALVGFFFASANPWAGTAVFFVVGTFGTSLVPLLQIRLMDVAGEAQTLAAALNQSALNIANAAGATIGGAVIAAGFQYHFTALAGASLAFMGMVVWVSMMLTRQKTRRRVVVKSHA